MSDSENRPYTPYTADGASPPSRLRGSTVEPAAPSQQPLSVLPETQTRGGFHLILDGNHYTGLLLPGGYRANHPQAQSLRRGSPLSLESTHHG
jgi:hypothetical protein